MDSPSERPSKSMYWMLALMSKVTVAATHFVGTSDKSEEKKYYCTDASNLVIHKFLK